MSKWIYSSKSKPCPICNKGQGWCTVSPDGEIALCHRISEGSYRENEKKDGWLHRIKESTGPRKPIPKRRLEPPADMSALAMAYKDACGPLGMISGELGVSELSLHMLDIGWDGEVWTFPMRDAFRRIIGISRRTDPKCAVTGSSNGIFWPSCVNTEKTRLFICEGPTDCAALLDLGFDAIGRQGCLGCVDIIKRFLQQGRREVIIVADRDEPKKRPDGSVWCPGKDGAMKLASEIKPLTDGVCVIQPPKTNDIRDWLKTGCNPQMVEALIRCTRWI